MVAGSEHQSLLSQDIHQSLLPQDQSISPCADRTFNHPCCRRIHSSVLALTGPSTILLPQDPRIKYCFTYAQ
ncbi:hypothetical protein ACLKA7_007788 [Drosophila subpalustris]